MITEVIIAIASFNSVKISVISVVNVWYAVVGVFTYNSSASIQ